MMALIPVSKFPHTTLSLNIVLCIDILLALYEVMMPALGINIEFTKLLLSKVELSIDR